MCFPEHKTVLFSINYQHWNRGGIWNTLSWNTRNHLSCIFNSMAVDGLVLCVARASTAMPIPSYSRIFRLQLCYSVSQIKRNSNISQDALSLPDSWPAFEMCPFTFITFCIFNFNLSNDHVHTRRPSAKGNVIVKIIEIRLFIFSSPSVRS